MGIRAECICLSGRIIISLPGVICDGFGRGYKIERKEIPGYSFNGPNKKKKKIERNQLEGN